MPTFKTTHTLYDLQQMAAAEAIGYMNGDKLILFTAPIAAHLLTD